MKPISTLTAWSLALSGLVLLGGCNTIRGFGKDTEKAGEVIQETAEDASDDIEDDGAPGTKQPSQKEDSR